MPGSIFGIPTRPTSGQGILWTESMGGRMDTGSIGAQASALSGLTLNRVPFGNGLGGLQDSGNLTFDGSTLALTGAQTITGQWASTLGSGTALAIASTTLTTSSITGCATFAGGVGMASDLRMDGVLYLGNDTSGAGGFIFNSAAGNTRDIAFRSAGSNRWILRCTSTAESGGNAGSDLQLLARTDAGAAIDTPISLLRVAGGALTIARPVSLSTASSGLTLAITSGTSLVISSTTDATTISTGSVTLAGGIGITKAAWIGGLANIAGVLTCANTTDATTATAAGTVVSGGLGVTKNILGKQGLGWGVTSVVTAAGTTTLASTSTTVQVFTGSTTQNVTLPAANVFGAGIGYVVIIKNVSSGTVTVNRAGSDTINDASSVTSKAVTTFTAITLISDGVSAWELV